MSKIFDFTKKVLDKLSVDGSRDKTLKPIISKVTNSTLLTELVDHFNERMKELSVGKRLLYPMSFNILMHPDDYNSTKESLPFVLPEVVAAFYACIKKKRDSYIDGVNYAPPATYWFFQFSACQIGTKNGQEDFIKRGEIITTGSLTTFDILKARNGGMQQEANVNLSVKCQNSNTNNNNINMKALLGMEILGEGSYSFNFDKNLSEDRANIVAASNSKTKGWATLRWANGDGRDNIYEMFYDYIDISGKADTRPSNNIVKINSDAVSVSHVQIKFEQMTQSFMLAAYAKTRLNSKEVPLSVGGNPIWVPISKFKSKIFLNDAVCIEFNANSDLL